jgi:hypothetical protein
VGQHPVHSKGDEKKDDEVEAVEDHRKRNASFWENSSV